MFLPSLATLRLIGAAILAVGLVLTGWTARGWKEDAARLKERDEELTFFVKNGMRWAQINSKVSGEYAQEKAGREADRLSFEERLHRARTNQLVQVNCPKQQTAAVGEPQAADTSGGSFVGFNAEFAGLWNDALAQGSTEAERAGRVTADSRWPGLADPLDLLRNTGENGRRWAECRAQVRGWQLWATQNGFMQ